MAGTNWEFATMSITKHRVPLLVAAIGGWLLSACNGVGDGNKLESLVAVPTSQLSSLTYDELKAGTHADGVANLCIASGVSMVGVFTKNDSFADFTQRVTWSSSNPAVATITNGGEIVPGTTDGTVYNKGVVLPVSVGSTVMTGTYLGESASVTVNVGDSGEITLEPQNPRLAVNTRQSFRVTSVIDGIKQDITSSAYVAAFSPANDTVATAIVSSAVPLVTALAVGDPLNLNVTLPICGRTLSTTVRVATANALVLQHEAGYTGDVIALTNESLKALVDFGDGPEQDVSAQSAFTVDVTTDTAATTRVTMSGNFANALVAGAPVSVTAACCVLDRNADGDTLDDGEAAALTSAAALPVTPVAGTLTSFAIAPTDASVEQYSNQQFTATGTFDSGARTQSITRLVTWLALDPVTSTATVPVASPLFCFCSGSTSTNGAFSTIAGLGIPVLPPTGVAVTTSTPVTISATLADTLQPTTALPAVTTTLNLLPLGSTTPAP
jgi:hypothetical protein